MSGFSKGLLFVTVVAFLGVVYYFFFEYNAPDTGGKSYHGDKVTNYLDSPPELVDPLVRMQIGQPAPLFNYAAIDGRVVRLSEHKGSKAVVIDFWATWCPPCQKEIPILEKVYRDNQDKLVIIAISSEDASMAGAIRSFAHNQDLSFDVVHDPTQSIEKMYPHNGIPYLVLIDKDGKVVDVISGYSPGVGDEITKKLGL